MRLDTNDPRLMDFVLGELEDGVALDVAAALENEENKDARDLVEELRGVAETTRRILREDDAVEALSDEQRAAIVGQAEEGLENVTPFRIRVVHVLAGMAAVILLGIATSIIVPTYGGSSMRVYTLGDTMEAPAPGDTRLSRRYIDPQHMLPTHPSSAPATRGAGRNAMAQQEPSSSLQNVEIDGSIRIRGNYYDWDDNVVMNGGEDRAFAGQRTRLGEEAEFTDDVAGHFEATSRIGGDEAAIVEARNRLEMKANLKDGLSLRYDSDLSEPKPEPMPEPKPGASGELTKEEREALLDAYANYADLVNRQSRPADEQWAEYNVGNLTGQTELPEQVASNFPDETTGLSLGADQERLQNAPWQWNSPTNTQPTEIVGGPGTETYVKVAGVKPFSAVKDEPLSTFSIDVDTAAYSNVRRFLNQGQLPPPDAVRIEEMINYFAYAYPQPTDGRPFAVAVMGAPAPWDPTHSLVRIGVKGKEVPASERPPANLVFLLDVSGSMGDANKLPLVKESMKTLLSQLRPNDRVSIVTYAGNARKVLDPTPCSEPARIVQAIDSLQSGGGTNGGGGIQMAYDLAQAGFIREGINRVILATDGDFNVGMTAHGDLMSMIEARAKSGVFLTALGFGMGNLKDSTLEQLADRGNGNYAYIDNHAEARRALVDQLSGTLQTIAKDVKIQVEFNPAKVSHYRLLGYENRALANQDFNDDTKDAGEIGAGHTVTALYEIIPTGGSPAPGVDPLRYQSTTPGVDPLKYGETGVSAEEDRIAPQPEPTGEWLTVKMRYKQPEGNESTKIEAPLLAMNRDLRETDADFRFASAVAAFGQVLRNSGYRHPSNFDRIIEMARGAANGDVDRESFVDMVITAKTLCGPR